MNNYSGPSAKTFYCSFQECPWEATASRGPLVNHLNSLHLPAGQVPAPTWIHLMGLWQCQACNLLIPAGKLCKGFRHAESGRPAQGPVHRLDDPEPADSPSVVEILQLRSTTLRHIPLGARAHCGKCLGQLLRDLVRELSWETLKRLLIFPKYVLQLPSRWGARHRAYNLRQIQERCSNIFDLPLNTLMEALQGDRPERPQRKRKRGLKPGETEDLYDEVLESQLQALISDGALGKALAFGRDSRRL